MKNNFKQALILTLALFASGCIGTKHLKEGEYLLYNQKITFTEKSTKENLKRQLVQQHNSRIWFLPISPYIAIYYTGLRSYDSAKYVLKLAELNTKLDSQLSEPGISEKKQNKYKKKYNKKVSKVDKTIAEGNLFMRWGEPIAIFDSAQVQKSQRNIEVYMKSHGWFLAAVDYQVKFDNKLTRINYLINEGYKYTIDTIFYDIPDSAVKNIIMESRTTSKLKIGDGYNQDNMSAERERLDVLLKNNGYFNFSRQFIQYRVDSTAGDHQVKIQLRVLSPKNSDLHKPFRIDSVIFSVDPKYPSIDSKLTTFSNKGITYNFSDRYYSEKVLSRRIHLKPGDLYSKKNTLNTQRELASMDMYKFVNINYDTTGNRFLANIFVSPLHRYQWSAEAGITVTQSLPGPFASISLKQRNVFKTLGVLDISGNIGVEGVAAASNPNAVLASLEAGAFVSLTFPRFFLPISDGTKAKLGLYSPKTIFSGGISFTDRPEYTRSNLSAYNSYSWEPKQHTLFDFRILEVALTKTNHLDSAYYERLKDLEANGNNLINSFRPSFLSNQRFTRSVNKNNYGSGNLKSSYFSILFEPGGTFTNLWARDFFAKDSVEIYAYVKLDTDFRKIIAGNKNKKWALRIRSGVAIPYGANGLLPYEKYFFSGGSISNRAWKPRRLGPGSYNHIDENGQVSYKFEQQGEIILESSLEYRQRIIGMLHWAGFVDAGNIWTINEDNARPGSQFKFNKFYQEIAVGAGLGLRFDFSFFIIRVDVAAKIIDPARPLGSRFILSSGFYDAPFDDPKFTEPILYTLSIGYPF